MLDLPYLPRLSLYDPAEGAEGSIDPLGLALLADRLASELVPGFTERSRRPRFLVVLALGSRILSREPYPDGVYGSHADGPANIAFERLVLEAFGQKGERGEADLIGVPGIGKARAAAEAGARLSSALYLMHPGAVGHWVAYKRLARDLEILDDDGHLLENGFRLLAAWEQGLGQPGLAMGSGGETEAFLKPFDEALLPLLGDGPSRRQPQREWTFLYQHLRPGGLSSPERKLLQHLLTERDVRRSEVFAATLKERRGRRGFLEVPEIDVLRSIEDRAEADLRTHVRTILAYERVVVLLRRAFRCLLHVGGRRGDGRIGADAIIADRSTGAVFRAMPGALSAALAPAEEILHETGHGELARETPGLARRGRAREPRGPLRCASRAAPRHAAAEASRWEAPLDRRRGRGSLRPHPVRRGGSASRGGDVPPVPDGSGQGGDRGPLGEAGVNR